MHDGADRPSGVSPTRDQRNRPRVSCCQSVAQPRQLRTFVGAMRHPTAQPLWKCLTGFGNKIVVAVSESGCLPAKVDLPTGAKVTGRGSHRSERPLAQEDLSVNVDEGCCR